MQVCAVKDFAVDAFMNPFCVPHLGLAARSFEDEVMKSDSPMNKHPKDYALYHLGAFDAESGKFDSLATPHMLARAGDFIKGE